MLARTESMRGRAFQVAVAIGTISNFAAAAALVASPAAMVAALSLPPIKSFRADVWARDAGLLLFFLSLMYIPVILDPLRHRWNAGVAVLSRFGFAAFWGFLVAFADYPRPLLGVMFFDGSVGLVQAILYVALIREASLRA